MGVFDFVRDVGAKVGIGKSTDERKQEAQAKEDAKAKAAAEAQKRRDAVKQADAAQREKAERKARIAERRAEAAKSKDLEDYVNKLGLNVKNLDIRYDNGTAYVEGTVPTEADREKVILAVGNVDGVAKVDEELDVESEAKTADNAEFHTVQSGDTLWKISERVYGDGNRYMEIFEANKPMLSDPDKIYPGQVLRIPK